MRDVAGFIFNLDSVKALTACVERGVYSTRLKPPKGGQWHRAVEGTFGDYIVMKPGDNVYFFRKRTITGIGQLVHLVSSCRFANFPGASQPNAVPYESVKRALLDDSGPGSQNHRCTCAFRPAPFFFKQGIDMDDALASNPPAFRSLRAMWKRSFVQLDDQENQALKDAIIKKHEEVLRNPVEGENVYRTAHPRIHGQIAERLTSGDYSLAVADLIRSCEDGSCARHEMAIEAALLSQLVGGEPSTTSVFGEWDHLSHQTIASPFKPIDYMDRMDVFGYAFVPGFAPTISKYLVVELKKGTGLPVDIGQTLKYVDWVRDEYAHGDYSMIRAFLIAKDFSGPAITYARDNITRHFTVERRPPRTEAWNKLTLVQYQISDGSDRIEFTPLQGGS